MNTEPRYFNNEQLGGLLTATYKQKATSMSMYKGIDLEYVHIPSYASWIDENKNASQSSMKVATAPPKSEPSTVSPPSPSQVPQTPSKQPFNIPSAILASGISLPSPAPRSPRKAPDLMSTKEPLSLPTTTNHFRRFAAKSGPIWWIQDRAEEILLWKRGWKLTAAWMSAYAFLCKIRLL